MEHLGSALDDAARRHPILEAALTDLRSQPGFSNVVADAVLEADVEPVDLDRFLSLAIRQFTDWRRYSLGIAIPDYVVRFGSGRDALAFCLDPANLQNRHHRRAIAATMAKKAAADIDLTWTHWLLTSVANENAPYHTFVHRNEEFVVRNLFDDLTTYVLEPARGPGDYLCDTLAIAMDHAPDPAPFQQRWYEWISSGEFDVLRGESVRVAYAIFNDYWDRPQFDPVARAMERRTLDLLSGADPRQVTMGLDHVFVMARLNYRGARRVLEVLPGDRPDLPDDQRYLYAARRRALLAVIVI